MTIDRRSMMVTPSFEPILGPLRHMCLNKCLDIMFYDKDSYGTV